VNKRWANVPTTMAPAKMPRTLPAPVLTSVVGAAGVTGVTGVTGVVGVVGVPVW